MSDMFYPLALTAGLTARSVGRATADVFDDGATATRRLWADKNLKRRFQVRHENLLAAEVRWLRGFFTQRNGGVDSFWYRDNLSRGGNAKVRFTPGYELALAMDAAVIRELTVNLEEIAPVRILPEIDEVMAAAGSAPLVWWDANRAKYFEHLGTAYKESQVHDSSLAGNYPGAIQAGTLPLGNILSQWQWYAPDGTFWARSAGNVVELAGTQPALTLFALAKAGAGGSTHQVLFGAGASGAGQSFVLTQASDDGFYASLDHTGATQTLIHNNAAANTWRSLAATVAAASNSVTPYANAVAGSPATLARTHTAGPALLAANAAGAGKVEAGSAVNLAQCLLFNAALTLAQIKALHNLFAHQYGLAIVP